jgi:ubiquitin C-terminal hydrolase
MNASLQALFASPKFCRYLSRLHLIDPNKSTSEKEEVLASLAWLGKVIGHQEIFSDEDSQNVDAKVNVIGKLLAQERLAFDPKYQHDAHEFVIKFLEELQKDIKENEDDDRDVCNDLFKLVSSYLPTCCPR